MNENDEAISQAVFNSLKTDPRLNQRRLPDVSVADGIVTLAGSVGSYREKLIIQEKAELVPGVKAVVGDIAVELPPGTETRDQELAESACQALSLNSTIPSQRLELEVEGDWVTINGTVDWLHEKEEAESTVAKIKGVKGITNNIIVTEENTHSNVTGEIERAFQHVAAHHAAEIHAKIKGKTAVLTGTARAYLEKVIAEEVLRDEFGMKEVDNQIRLSPLLNGKE